MPLESFYRRPLPATHVAFACPDGRTLFREALASGGMDSWYALAEHFHTQSEPQFCGLGTLVVVLNALGIDPGRLWKGPWRWFSEEMLEGCLPPDVVRTRGISLDELACVARCNGANAEVIHADETTLERFRADLRQAVISPEGPFLVANYSRKVLGQTGEGHFSPLAGLHVTRDLALVLDVARFKYPPHWVPIERLWLAMQPLDSVSGRSRGWAMLRRGPLPPAVCCALAVDAATLAVWERFTKTDLPAALLAERPKNAEGVLATILRLLPPEVLAMISIRGGSDVAAEHRRALDSVLDAIVDLQHYAAFARAAEGDAEQAARLAIVFLLSPDETFAELPTPLRKDLARLRDPAALPSTLSGEICRVQFQLSAIRDQLSETTKADS